MRNARAVTIAAGIRAVDPAVRGAVRVGLAAPVGRGMIAVRGRAGPRGEINHRAHGVMTEAVVARRVIAGRAGGPGSSVAISPSRRVRRRHRPRRR